jgi:CBS domain-containing protein
MLNYKAIEIFTSEEARFRNRPLTEVVIEYIKDLKTAARCMVTRGIAGCYESGDTATSRLEVLSHNLPVHILIILPAGRVDRVLADLDPMISDGILALHDLNVVSHRAKNKFFPRQLRVRDVMTIEPRHVDTKSSLSDAVRLLLSSVFTGLPVVDESHRPVGIVTQGDLIKRGGLPLRLGLIEDSDPDSLDALMENMTARSVDPVMSAPVVMIQQDRPLDEAVDLMLANGVKRLPVVDDSGILTGMLSRLDIFRTVMREAPDWKAFKVQEVEVKNLRTVEDVLRRDTHTVSPQTPLDEVILIIDANDIQRVAVVDSKGKLLGLISDRDLLRCFKQENEGIRGFLSKMKPRKKDDASGRGLPERLGASTAGMVMTTDLIVVREDMLIEEAIALMTYKALKRLPVVDETGRFKGMISRDSLLRTGFGRWD